MDQTHRKKGKNFFSAAATAFLAAFLGCLVPSMGACFPMDFTMFRLGNTAPVVLVVGGIQGDEPGGFSAATLLATRYEISSGTLLVVPNLNFPSIIKRSRGLHGDMNRKFAVLDASDPEYGTVRRIQELISAPDVGLVLNLHDGSGYYRPKYEDRLKNPARWGQSVIIDQENLPGGVFMGALKDEADLVVKSVNQALVKPLHAIHVHNTNTAAGDHEMEKSLSYFAVRQNKAAFGIEASKEFPVALRAYYHLQMVENFLRMAGLRFSRDFELTPAGIERAMSENLGVSFAGNRIFLPLEDARPTINRLPLPKSCVAKAITSKPIMAVLPCEDREGQLCVHYGNRTVAFIHPEWREMEDDLDGMEVVVDGRNRFAPFGQLLDVEETALVKSLPGYRVNAIGLDRGLEDESGIKLRRTDFETRFSLDKAGRIFRIEVYRGPNLAGMFLLRFSRDGKGRRAEARRSSTPGLPTTNASQGS